MLIDPAYNPAPKYSGTSTGIQALSNSASAYVTSGLALKNALLSAGWTVVGSGQSYTTQVRYAFIIPVTSGIGFPREMTSAECTSGTGALSFRAYAGGLTYIAYDPFELIPTCAGGTNDIRWYPMGLTSEDTADNLAAKISGDGTYSASVTGVVGDPSAGGGFEFTFISLAPAFEFDELPIDVGVPTGTPTLRGYYTLRSPSPGGSYLEVKVETRRVNNSGGFFAFDGVGSIRTCLTVTASGGGSYYMPLMPGSYRFAANYHQFLIWPGPTAVASRNANTSILASLIEAPAEHLTAGNCPLVIGSNNGDLGINPDHLRNSLHWSQSLACGHSSTMDDTQWRKGDNDGYKKVAMLVRGTKGAATTGLNGQALVQAPYVALPSNPTSGPGPIVAGRLWDIVTTSGKASLGTSMMHDGRRWECFSTSAASSDVGCDMWILKEPS